MNNRKKNGHHLQREIARILLEVNFRLRTWKGQVTIDAKRFRKKIASTQQLMDKSVKRLKRFAGEFGVHHDARCDRSVTTPRGGVAPNYPLSRAVLTES